jgi:hypothetical protein
MNSTQLGSVVTGMFDECRKVLVAKGHDYTQANEDRLHNFKSIADLIPLQCPHCQKSFKLPARIVWLVYFLKHVWSIVTWAGLGKQESGESRTSRFVDIINYSSLGEAIGIDEESQPKVSDDGIPF